jgi:pyrimidine-nucleoside phosphorylase
MNPVRLIRKKRDRESLSRTELQDLIGAYVRGELPDYQMSAFLMAVYFSGMDPEESAALTEIMLHSGKIVDLSSVPGRKVDKHSTGGVGDKVSLILAPMVAACGVPVPMISGRGLGHTGGTLDKLESIPGFRTDLSIEEYCRVLTETGLVMIGQTGEIAPADRKMYALRDVTGTVECIPLIAGSIMSKKLAEGIDALVLDVKTGSGAFMQSEERAVALARALVEIGTRFGKQTIAFITEMDQPLGRAIGNWLEVEESVECLRGKNVPDLMEVTFVLGGAMVFLGGKAASIEEGIALCRSAIWSGRAYEKFLQIVARQGGDTGILANPSRYARPRFSVEVHTATPGTIIRFDTREIGVLAVELGAGRRELDEPVDPKAGILLRKKLGEHVVAGEILAVFQTDRGEMLAAAEQQLRQYIHVGDGPIVVPPRIRALVDERGVAPWRTLEVF